MLVLDRGRTGTFPFTVHTAEGALFDLSGCTVTLNVLREGVVVFAKTSASPSQITIAVPSSGAGVVNFLPADTATLADGVFFYELLVDDGGGDLDQVDSGPVEVRRVSVASSLLPMEAFDGAIARDALMNLLEDPSGQKRPSDTVLAGAVARAWDYVWSFESLASRYVRPATVPTGALRDIVIDAALFNLYTLTSQRYVDNKDVADMRKKSVDDRLNKKPVFSELALLTPTQVEAIGEGGFSVSSSRRIFGVDRDRCGWRSGGIF